MVVHNTSSRRTTPMFDVRPEVMFDFPTGVLHDMWNLGSFRVNFKRSGLGFGTVLRNQRKPFVSHKEQRVEIPALF